MKPLVWVTLILLVSANFISNPTIILEEEESAIYAVGLSNNSTAFSFEGVRGTTNSIHSTEHATCMIAEDYSLYCWGSGRNSQANGFGNTTTATTPMKVNLLNGTTYTSVITMNKHTCVLFTNQTVGCFGLTDYGLGTGSLSLNKNTTIVYPLGNRQFEAISGSNGLICGFDSNSTIYCSGNNERVNSGNQWHYRLPGTTYTIVQNHTFNVNGLGEIHQLYVGHHISCAVNTNGELYCWGKYYFDCPTTVLVCSNPQKISTPNNATVVQVAVDENAGGNKAACFLFSNNSVACAGDFQGSGAIQSGYLYWRTLSSDAVAIKTSYLTSCALLDNGEVDCWGYYANRFGTVNSGNNFQTTLSEPSGGNFTAMSMGGNSYAFVCLTNSSGIVMCKGGVTSYYSSVGQYSNGYYYPEFPNEVRYVSSQIDPDYDSLNNPFDFCPDGYSNWNYNSSLDNDRDGCHDVNEDIDDDNDGFSDFTENSCHSDSLNKTSVPTDFDSDGTCDSLDNDDDNDGVTDVNDAFPNNAYEQSDSDNDGVGNNADNDDDNDNWLDSSDDFPLDPSEWRDLDNDGTGDNSDIDDDGDGWNDTMEDQCGTDRNQSSSYPSDLDGDYICDSVDSDDDGDSYLDVNDDFPNDATEWIDSDNDGTGDNADTDDDNDGTIDANDAFPLNPNEDTDTDGDGTGNNADSDDDNDGTNDANDEFPLDASEVSDNDGDGVGDNADTDDDNDGWSDADENSCVSDPLSSSITPMDFDNDGICDQMDVDDDNDGWTDMAENNCSSNPRSAASIPNDAEGDGICDADDLDDDNDGFEDDEDAFPNDNSEWYDTDGDGIGNNEDTDDDGDGWTDSQEYACGTNQTLAASVPSDIDTDGLCAALDQDDDGDGWFDFVEINCQSDANNSQVVPLDTDGDSLCDVLDDDDDDDGWNDTTELNCQTNPLNRTSLPLDTDSDMICDLLDDDDDNDGTLDSEDQAPLDPTDTRDLDGDSIGDASDDDIDGDGFTNADETSCESNPSDANSIPIDTDGDGVCDEVDALPEESLDWLDSDGDGVGDNQDAFPSLSSEQYDYDNDGTGNNVDFDDDGDGISDSLDQCQESETGFISNPGSDYDSDGCSNEEDMDDDNDGIEDTSDTCPTSQLIGAMNNSVDADGDGCDDMLEDDDQDNDGVLNVDDSCEDTLKGRTVDVFGCDLDTDNDLIPDDLDDCDNTTVLSEVNQFGCYDDDDSDGVPNFLDAFISNPNESIDSDADGVGDNSDAFPLNSNETTDTDNDGVGDNTDQCPNGEIKNNGLAGCSEVKTDEASSFGAAVGGGSVGGLVGVLFGALGMVFFMRRNENPLLIEKETPSIAEAVAEPEIVAQTIVPTGPSIDAIPNNTDEHGFEWIQHNSENYYRKADSNDEWLMFQN